MLTGIKMGRSVVHIKYSAQPDLGSITLKVIYYLRLHLMAFEQSN